jgi:hypothetical protein
MATEERSRAAAVMMMTSGEEDEGSGGAGLLEDTRREKMKPTCGVHPPVTNKWNPHRPDGW